MALLHRVRIRLNRLLLLPFVFTACMALPSSATVPIDTCVERPQQWVCFGYIELHSSVSITRIFNYDNHEMLVESEQSGKRRRLINTRKGMFIDHLKESNSPSYLSSSFISHALAPIFLTLPIAYPDGPASVPGNRVTQAIRIDLNNTATVTTSRSADGNICFDIRIVGDDIPPVTGSYHLGSLPPLPGDFDLRGWNPAPIPGLPEQTPRTPEPALERIEQLR